MAQSNKGPISRGMSAALFFVALTWAAAAKVIAARAADGIAVRFRLGAVEALLECLFLLFVVVVGLRVLDWIATGGRFAGDVLALPKRAGRWGEWGRGAALGWGMCLAVVLPLLLSGHLHARLRWEAGSAEEILLALATLLAISLAEEVIFRGYALRRLTQVMGQAWAGSVIAVIFGVVVVMANPPLHLLTAFLNETLFGILLAVAWMRTRGLWLGWGVHFAYRAVMAVALGLPIAGQSQFGAIADTFSSGPRWLSGGAFGLDAALLTVVALVGGIAVLYRVTREYAWKYTFDPIVAGGYEVVVTPPAAHVAMEKAVPAPAPLVQILATTPQSRSVEERDTM